MDRGQAAEQHHREEHALFPSCSEVMLLAQLSDSSLPFAPFAQHSVLMQVSGRMLKYVAQAGRVSQWIAAKLQSSIAKNMLFPSCSDIRLPHLMAADHDQAALARAAFLTALHVRGEAPEGEASAAALCRQT